MAAHTGDVDFFFPSACWERNICLGLVDRSARTEAFGVAGIDPVMQSDSDPTFFSIVHFRPGLRSADALLTASSVVTPSEFFFSFLLVHERCGGGN